MKLEWELTGVWKTQISEIHWSIISIKNKTWSTHSYDAIVKKTMNNTRISWGILKASKETLSLEIQRSS